MSKREVLNHIYIRKLQEQNVWYICCIAMVTSSLVFFRETEGQVESCQAFYFESGKSKRWSFHGVLPSDAMQNCSPIKKSMSQSRCVWRRAHASFRRNTGFSDESTALQIQENAYLQYFCGYKKYDDSKPPFYASLMVYFCKRLTTEILGESNEMILQEQTAQRREDDDDKDDSNHVTMIVDATCAPSQIKYTQGRYPKAGSADNGTKRRVIAENSHKYSISAMCDALNISRSVYYYKENPKEIDIELDKAVINEFYINKQVYGTRKFKKELTKKQNGHAAITVSRRKIMDIMAKYMLVSKYDQPSFKWASILCRSSAVKCWPFRCSVLQFGLSIVMSFAELVL